MFKLINPLRTIRPTNLVSKVKPISALRFNSDFNFKPLGSIPKQIKFTQDHEWLTVHENGSCFLGITKYAADALGDATFIELPEVNEVFESGDTIGSVESVKSASEIYTPVGGKVRAVNEVLSGNPGLINQDPMGEGWLIELEVDTENFDELMDEEGYKEFLNQ